MSELQPNRPHIEDTPVEGPIPFTDMLTPIDAYVVGGMPANLDPLRLSARELAALGDFRERYPIYYHDEYDGIDYPDGAIEFAEQKFAEALAERQPHNPSAERRMSFGRKIIDRLTRRGGNNE